MGDPLEPASRFEVLGPLRAWHSGQALALGPVQQRVVLAVLLAHANRPVGRPALIDAIWGDAAPTSAVNLLQRHASALRRVIEPDRAGHAKLSQLTWTDSGYSLTVAPGALDLEVFENEVGQARAARSAGNLPAAAQALHAALSRWRGPAFDGLSSPFLDAQREALAERRITVTEDRIEVDLAIGDHPDLVGELRDLVADHPLRERLRGLLMLALYRCDRQADALAAFQDARRCLRDELGLEPAARLQALHQQILAGDPELAAPVPAGARRTPAPSPAPARQPAPAGGPDSTGGPGSTAPAGRPATDAGQPAPAQLPHNAPHFVGRRTELDRLSALLPGTAGDAGGAVPITAIAGTAGVGKTALAVHWAHQIKDAFPDGQLYVNLRGFDPTGAVLEPAEAIRGFLDAFAVPTAQIPVSLDAQAARYRSLLAGRRVLIVLDNARDADQVRPLLPGSPSCLVIVTSRNSLTSLVAANGAQPVVLDLLTAAEARRLLAIRIGQSRVDTEPDAVDEVIAACAGLPLALAIVAARAAIQPKFPLDVLATELLKAHSDLDVFVGDDATSDIRTVFSWSYDQLSDAAAKLFRLLSLHPGPDLATPAVASLAGVPVGQVRRLLGELTRAHLLIEHVPHRFTLHDLLRTYATEQTRSTDTEADQRAAVHRLLDHYVHTAYAAHRLLDPQADSLGLPPARPEVTVVDLADHDQALAWFTAEHAVLLGAVEAAAAARFDPHAWQLARVLATYLDRRGHWRESVAVQGTALGAVTRLADEPGQALAHRSLARGYAQLGRYDDAHTHLQQALDLYGRLDDAAGRALTHYALAHVLNRQGRYQEALDHAERTLDLHRVTGQRAGQAAALNAVGWFHALLGDHERALVECQQALALHQELDDRYGQAATWDSVGYAYHHLRQHDRADDCFRHAVALWRNLGDRFNEADTLARRGDSRHAAGDREAARDAWRQAKEILDELGHADADVLHAKLTA